jgi:RNA polymerase sigma-70 factor (ECF subfamily)
MVSIALGGEKGWGLGEDARLAALSAAGDDLAFQALYERHYGRVYALALGVLLDHDDASDAAQEVFVTVYRNIGRFDGRSRFTTWLYRVALNRCIQQARRLRPRKLREASFDEAGAQGALVENARFCDDGLEQAMSRLDPSDRAALVLFYWEDQSLQEIGRALGCSPNAAKTRLFRARARLRALLEEKGE